MMNGKELIMTEKMLLNSLTEVAMEFGEQSIEIAEQDIADLSIEEISVSNIGTQTSCSCSFTLNKPVAQFSVSAVVDYAYNQEHGWMLQNINYTKHKLEALHLDSLKGKWAGEIADLDVSSYTEHAMNFEITEVDNEEGTMKAMDLYTSVLKEHQMAEMEKFDDILAKINLNKDSLAEERYEKELTKKRDNIVNYGDYVVV